MRSIIAKFVIDDELEEKEQEIWEKCGGPLSYFEEKAAELTQSGIELEHAILVEQEGCAEEKWDQYMTYLTGWIFEHSWEDKPISPKLFEEFIGTKLPYEFRRKIFDEFQDENYVEDILSELEQFSGEDPNILKQIDPELLVESLKRIIDRSDSYWDRYWEIVNYVIREEIKNVKKEA